MISGLGIDIVEISRIEKVMKRASWLHRLFTQDERNELEKRGFPPESVAGRFAAKEAVGKALGISMSLGTFSSIEIFTVAGQPKVDLGSAIYKDSAFAMGDRMHISISHDKSRAIAIALWERRV